jgi:protein-L-isoaspartate(D-aspartate) O-methyltransferase
MRVFRILPLLIAVGCGSPPGCKHPPGPTSSDSGKKKQEVKESMEQNGGGREQERLAMVATQIKARGVKDEQVLEAMRTVPRHIFVPESHQDQAYEDHPLPIGQGQTISQPYIVAVMSEAMELTGEEKVLEVGTGSGYQAAVLSHLCKEVHTIEIVEELAARSKKTLADHGYDNVTVYAGDGYAGLPDEAPFDAIMITAAPPKVPEPLKQQLTVGGRLVLPVGTTYQSLIRIRRTAEDAWKREEVLSAVIFVPMTGKIQKI